MKRLLFIILTFVSSCSISSQNEILATVDKIRNAKEPAKGEAICTPSYWTTKMDSGERAFKRLCRREFELRGEGKKFKGKRGVYTLGIWSEGKKRDEIYMYLVKSEGDWLIDGINESENMQDPFLDKEISGHFQPTDLPENPELAKIGSELAGLTGAQNHGALLGIIDKTFTKWSDLDLLREFSTDEYKISYSSSGYIKGTNKGYISFSTVEERAASYNRDGFMVLYVEKDDKKPDLWNIHVDIQYEPSSRVFFGRKRKR